MVSLNRLRRGDLRIEDRGPTLYVWSSLAHYGLRALFLPKIRRDKKFVINEYNNERNEYWKPSLSLDEFIFGDARVPIWVLVDDKLVRGNLRMVRERLLPRLRDRVAQYSKPGDLVVEFGAGTGRNLAYLARELPDRRYLGLELTPHTVEEAQRTMKEYNLPIEMKVADVTHPLGLDKEAAVSISVLALEQLPGALSKDALAQMAATARNAIVCFEPIRELFPYSIRGLTARLRLYQADYLSGLPEYARQLGLRVVVQERSKLAANPLNEMGELVIKVD
jgi:SAM-dependent methyltransferase